MSPLSSAGPSAANDETLKAALGVLGLLLGTELTLEQKHYALALERLLTQPTQPEAPPPQTSEPASAYIDREVLAELYRYLPPSGCTAIVTQFRNTAAQLMGTISEALAAEASEALAQAAHSLIGTVGAVGMTQMAQEARAIVVALQHQDWPLAAERAAALPPLYRASMAALDTTLESFPQQAP